MGIFDISRIISQESVVYPGDGNIILKPSGTIPETPCNVTLLCNWTTHILTHVDAPSHFIENGKSIEDIPLSRFVGNVYVVNIPDEYDEILPEHFEKFNFDIIKNIFFKTRNSKIKTENAFYKEFVYMGEKAAQKAIELNLNMIGIDYLSIEKYGVQNYTVHKTLLKNEIIILEGLDLSMINEGTYKFSALPLKIKNADGSPVRAILQTE
ncbi:MAG: cyclase family protein [Bacteroidales bacterium]|jgi:arylformamidase|nr:cyclase family protein [Bacteroidales bacterium]